MNRGEMLYELSKIARVNKAEFIAKGKELAEIEERKACTFRPKIDRVAVAPKKNTKFEVRVVNDKNR